MKEGGHTCVPPQTPTINVVQKTDVFLHLFLSTAQKEGCGELRSPERMLLKPIPQFMSYFSTIINDVIVVMMYLIWISLKWDVWRMKKVRMSAWMGVNLVKGCQGYHYLRCAMLSRPPLDAMPNSMRSKSSSSHSSNVRDNGALEAGLVWFVLVGLGLAVVAVSILQLVVVCCISIWPAPDWINFFKIDLKKEPTRLHYYFEFLSYSML